MATFAQNEFIRHPEAGSKYTFDPFADAVLMIDAHGVLSGCGFRWLTSRLR
jgi:hypothetical protein